MKKDTKTNKRKLVNINTIIDKINQRKDLSKEEKFSKVIDVAFEKIFKPPLVARNYWETKLIEAELLLRNSKRKSYEAGNMRIKDTLDEMAKEELRKNPS